MDPLPSNGTLRLPLKPVGLHSDETAPVLETPSDPPVHTTTTAGPPVQTSEPSATPTKAASESPSADEGDDKKGSWWDTIWDKVDDFKDWAGGVADAIKGNHPHADNE